MIKKFLLTLTVIAASSMAYAKNYNVTLFQPTLVGTTDLKAGDYKIEVTDEKAVLKGSKTSAEASVKVETAGEKFAATSVRYRAEDGKYRIQEIRIGGTTTKIVFNN